MNKKELALPAMAMQIANFWNQSVPMKAVTYSAVAIAILAYAPGHVQPFVYFQF
jgi:hypothetical protein